MWIIKYIGIVVLNGIVIAKIRITWFDGTEVPMTDVCVWIYIFWNMSHCKGVPSSTAMCHIWIYVTRFNVTHHKVLLNQLFQKLNFPTLYGAVQCGQPRWSNLRWKRWFMRYRNRVGTGTQDLFQISSITHPKIKIMIPNFWTEVEAETGPHWLKVPDTVEKRPMKFGKCSILMFYLEFRSWKLNFKLSVFLIEQKPGGRFGNGGNWEDPGILGRWILVVYRTTNQIGLFIVQLQSM